MYGPLDINRGFQNRAAEASPVQPILLLDDFLPHAHQSFVFFSKRVGAPSQSEPSSKKDPFQLLVCVCVLPSILQGSSGQPLRRLGYVSPAPQAIPKDLVIIHSRGSTWGDLFRPPPVPS